MKTFWNDRGRGPAPESALDLSQAQVQRVWSDEIRGVQGNFLGLIDDLGNTIQFYFTAGIPNDVEDARHLQIVLVDFPVLEERGSYSRQVTIGEVPDLIATVFEIGANPQSFSGLSFCGW